MKVKIEIDTRTFVRFWLVVIGFAIAILAIYSARTALIILGVLFFLALALNAPVSYLTKFMPGKNRIGGTAIAYIVVVALLGMFAFLVVPPIVEQTAKFAQTVPGLVEDVSSRSQGVGDFIEKYHLQKQVDDALNSAQNDISGWAASLGKNVLSGLGSLFGAVISTFLVLVLSFLMLVEGPQWFKRIWGMYHDKKRMQQHSELMRKMYGVVTGYVTGQLAVSGIGGVLAGVMVFILSLIFDVPTNLTLPTIAICFTLSLIPMFGATIAGILVSLLLLFNDPTAAIVFAIYFIVYQQVENNFISPVIQAKTVQLSALVVLGSVTIGLYVFGLAGGIISIPIAGCIKVLIEDWQERSRVSRVKSDKPMAKLVKKIQGDAS
ncbi:MAG: AI-2E family transporter [Candidatus Saccharimonadales bacterium]